MSYISLEDHLRIIFALRQFHHWQISEIENMIPWEREIYLQFLSDHIEEQKLKDPQLT
jgi:hypothetical protein